MPSSRFKKEIARLLKEEGYIADFRVEQQKDERGNELPYETLVIVLKYGRNRERVISGLKRVSKPGRRRYAGKSGIPRVLSGLGTTIVSTSKGVMTSRSAEEQGIGGEVVCHVW